MRPRSFALLLLLIATGGCSGASRQSEVLPQKAPGRYRETVASRTYTLVVPKAYDATKRLPLVVLLHGWMGDAAQILSVSGIEKKAEKEGFVVVAPEALGDPKGWNVGFLDLSGEKHPDDAAFVTSVIDQVEMEVGIDESRLFVMGHSNGAMLTHLVGAKLAARVAAIGAVAGTIGLPGQGGSAPLTIPSPSVPVSAILLHGQQDPLVAYDENHIALLNGIGAPACAKWWAQKDGITADPVRTNLAPTEMVDTYTGRDGAEVVLVTYPNAAHLWPSDATDLIWSFFAAHPKVRR